MFDLGCGGVAGSAHKGATLHDLPYTSLTARVESGHLCGEQMAQMRKRCSCRARNAAVRRPCVTRSRTSAARVTFA